MLQEFLDFMHSSYNEHMKKFAQLAMHEGRISGIVKGLRNLGQSTDEIKVVLTKIYHLDEEEALKYL